MNVKQRRRPLMSKEAPSLLHRTITRQRCCCGRRNIYGDGGWFSSGAVLGLTRQARRRLVRSVRNILVYFSREIGTRGASPATSYRGQWGL